MTTAKKVAAWISGIVFLLFLFAALYKQTYSMKVIQPFEVNNPTLKNNILIATQGSDFKDSIVRAVINELTTKPVYIRVIDVTELSNVKEDDWSAVVILYTWENWKPQEDAKLFIEQTQNTERLIVLSTSGQGEYKIEGIDGITSASKLSDVPAKSDEILRRIGDLLNASKD